MLSVCFPRKKLTTPTKSCVQIYFDYRFFLNILTGILIQVCRSDFVYEGITKISYLQIFIFIFWSMKLAIFYQRSNKLYKNRLDIMGLLNFWVNITRVCMSCSSFKNSLTGTLMNDAKIV